VAAFTRFHLVQRLTFEGVPSAHIVAEGIAYSDGEAALHWTTGPHRPHETHPGGVESILARHRNTSVEWLS
jgi:hypothetical protein